MTSALVRSILLLLAAIAPYESLAGEHWPSFRGDGSSTVTADLPTEWSPDEGVAWQADIPGYGQSSPVVWGDHVYVTSSEGPFQQDCQVHAFDLTTGKKLWTTHVEATTKVENYFRNSRAAPTCCVDDSCVYSFFASGDVTAMGHDGKPGFKVRWGAERANSYYSTPLAFAGYVYYVNKGGVLYCIDQETGEQVFAKRIGNPCWASAVGVNKPDGEQLVYFVLKNGFTIVLRPGDQYDQVARNQLYDAEAMMEAREAAEKQRKANAVPADQAQPKTGPEKVFAGMPETQLHQMFSYGDPMVYGIAVAKNSLLIRTGQRLFCVSQ